jgi:Flp pilus assembly protein TadG
MTRRTRYASRHHSRSSRGAALVEFGIVAPLLILLVFGILEFGWGFLQALDVRHAAREGGRLAAVNFGPGSGTTQTNAIIDEVCTRIDDTDGVEITISLPDGTPSTVGDRVHVTVERTFESLTGFFNFTDRTMVSEVDVRLEQDATFAAVTARPCP